MKLQLDTLLRHDRRIVAAGLILVTLASWWYLFIGAGMSMTGWEMTRFSGSDMKMRGSAPWDLSYAVLMFFMWWVMMIAMMLPSATPVILLSAALNRRSRSDTPPFGSTGAFLTGYLLAWAGFSLIAVFAQWALLQLDIISGMLSSRSTIFSAAILIGAGGWQFTSWKYACLEHCRSPVEFLTEKRRTGTSGALLTGLHHGAYCLGCCWFLMLLLFVGGVMNLFWIAGIAIYVWVEKILPSGLIISRVFGTLLIAWGITIMVQQWSG